MHETESFTSELQVLVLKQIPNPQGSNLHVSMPSAPKPTGPAFYKDLVEGRSQHAHFSWGSEEWTQIPLLAKIHAECVCRAAMDCGPSTVRWSV